MCFGGGGGDKNIGKAAKMQAELGKEQLQWFKDEYAATAADRTAAQKRANEISDFQMGQMRDADARADELYAFDKQYTRPIQERMATEALNYDTPERRQVEATGYARMADASNIGTGIAQRATQQTGIAAGAGQGAIGASTAALGARTSGLGGMQSAYQSAGNMMAQSGNLYGQNAQIANQASASHANTLAGLGSAAMMAFAISDKNKKKGTGKKADGGKALEQIERVPVHEGWEYDPAKGGPDDGGQPHTGPMAQDVAAVMGQQAAPGGKAIDLVTMSGMTMAAVQELSKRVKRLEEHA